MRRLRFIVVGLFVGWLAAFAFAFEFAFAVVRLAVSVVKFIVDTGGSS